MCFLQSPPEAAEDQTPARTHTQIYKHRYTHKLRTHLCFLENFSVQENHRGKNYTIGFFIQFMQDEQSQLVYQSASGHPI